jgi:hypothetical protein
MLIQVPGERRFELTDAQRVYGSAAGFIKFLRDGDRGILAHEILMNGEGEFIKQMRLTERPESLSFDLTDAQLGEVYDHICAYVRALGRKGHFLRKRKDWRG